MVSCSGLQCLFREKSVRPTQSECTRRGAMSALLAVWLVSKHFGLESNHPVSSTFWRGFYLPLHYEELAGASKTNVSPSPSTRSNSNTDRAYLGWRADEKWCSIGWMWLFLQRTRIVSYTSGDVPNNSKTLTTSTSFVPLEKILSNTFAVSNAELFYPYRHLRVIAIAAAAATTTTYRILDAKTAEQTSAPLPTFCFAKRMFVICYDTIACSFVLWRRRNKSRRHCRRMIQINR